MPLTRGKKPESGRLAMSTVVGVVARFPEFFKTTADVSTFEGLLGAPSGASAAEVYGSAMCDALPIYETEDDIVSASFTAGVVNMAPGMDDMVLGGLAYPNDEPLLLDRNLLNAFVGLVGKEKRLCVVYPNDDPKERISMEFLVAFGVYNRFVSMLYSPLEGAANKCIGVLSSSEDGSDTEEELTGTSSAGSHDEFPSKSPAPLARASEASFESEETDLYGSPRQERTHSTSVLPSRPGEKVQTTSRRPREDPHANESSQKHGNRVAPRHVKSGSPNGGETSKSKGAHVPSTLPRGPTESSRRNARSAVAGGSGASHKQTSETSVSKQRAFVVKTAPTK